MSGEEVKEMTFGAQLSPRLIMALITAMILVAAITSVALAWGPTEMPPFCPPHC